MSSTIASSLATAQAFNLDEEFGADTFSLKAMKKVLSPQTFAAIAASLSSFSPLSLEHADEVAHHMMKWAISRGATHYTHWFQPLTEQGAQKHDAFVTPTRDGGIIQKFKGKTLIGGEPDGSSFPTGGLRPTHKARGYTIWDPLTPTFIFDLGGVPTLFVPTLFFSWTGEALDRKIPLLRSSAALSKAALDLFDSIGEQGHKDIHSDSGVEQEFFMITKEDHKSRDDLLLTGRTLVGADAPKGQELDDHYFGSIPAGAWQAMAEAERVMYRLGVPCATRHQEVAPQQFETAPYFSRDSVASDQNLLYMDVLKRVAKKHDMVTLFHEKPFANLNGSGKHNNWSIGSSKTPSFMSPSADPLNDPVFCLTIAAVLRGVDTHADLLRWCIASAQNDHRLGGHEAPPSIMSVYLGDHVGAIVDYFVDGTPLKVVETKVDLGVPYLPEFHRDTSDRNRTSPVAFTSNKFELRAVGSSQTPGFSSMILNTITADSYTYFASEVRAATAGGASVDDAWKAVVKAAFTKHRRIINNGNGYASSWVDEAEKRGLPNYPTTADIVSNVFSDKNKALFAATKVWTQSEFSANVLVEGEKYVSKLGIEARALISMTNQQVIPAVINYVASIMRIGEYAPKPLLDTLDASLKTIVTKVAQLQATIDKQPAFDEGDISASVFHAKDVVLAAANSLREDIDAVEKVVDRSIWPMPSYTKLLFTAHD